MKWLIGIAAGAAAIYFLRTEKGKAFIDSVKKEANGISDTLCNLTEDLFNKGKSVASKVSEQANGAA
jgi:gas vesicle protein